MTTAAAPALTALTAVVRGRRRARLRELEAAGGRRIGRTRHSLVADRRVVGRDRERVQLDVRIVVRGDADDVLADAGGARGVDAVRAAVSDRRDDDDALLVDQ